MMRLVGCFVLWNLMALVGRADEAPSEETAEQAVLDESVQTGGLETPQVEGVPNASSDGEEQAHTLEELWAQMDSEVVLDQALARREIGDFVGSTERLIHLEQRNEDALLPVATFHLGLNHELQEEYRLAVAAYQTVLAQWPASNVAVDASFRMAICLADLGQYSESLHIAKRMEQVGEWSPLDTLSLTLVHGIAELRKGKTRRGTKRLQSALAGLEGSADLTWMRARARAALAMEMLKQAADYPLKGNRRAARNLKRRAFLMSAAEKQVVAIAVLNEPEYILEGLLGLGDAYLLLYEDMIGAPPPRSLTDEQVVFYKEQVANQAAILREKAARYYDEGVGVSIRTRWIGMVSQTLLQRRDALVGPLETPTTESP